MAPFYSQKVPQFPFKSAPSCRRLFLRLPKRVVFPLLLAVQITTNFPPKGSQSKVNLFSFPFLPPGRGRFVRPPPSHQILLRNFVLLQCWQRSFSGSHRKARFYVFLVSPRGVRTQARLGFPCPLRSVGTSAALHLPFSSGLLEHFLPQAVRTICITLISLSISIIPSFRFAIPSFAPRCVATRLNWFLVWFIILRV